MKIFFDNCISPVYARAMKILAEMQKYPIVHLREKFEPDTPDTDWISILAREGDWIILSSDPRISRGKAEKAIWKESGLTSFFFSDGWQNKSFWKQVEDLVHWWPDVILEARRASPGTGYLIPVKSKSLTVIFTP